MRLKLRDKLAKLFACVEPPKFVLKLATDEFRSLRIMTIRPLKMSTPLGKSTSEKHKKQMKRIVGLLKRFTVLDSSVTIHEQSELDSDYRQDFYQLESTAYYMFGKMLTDSNYSIGKKV